MTDEERKLKKALDESLKKSIEQVPSTEELQGKYVFTESFQLFMAQLIKKQEIPKRNKNKKKYFYSIIKAVACIVCIIGIGTLVFDLLSIPMGGMKSNNSGSTGSMSDESYEDEAQALEEADLGNIIAEDATEVKQEETGTGELGGKEDTVLWEARVLGFDDNSYTIEFTLKNLTDREIIYAPVYEWTYEVSGQERNQMEEGEEEKTYILEPNETVSETYNVVSFFNDMESGGILIAKRLVDGEEILCFIRDMLP